MADDSITLVSTTDSAEEVQAALTGTPVVPKETPPAPATLPPQPTPATPQVSQPAVTTVAEPDPAVDPNAPPPPNETQEQKTQREQLSARERRHKKIQEDIDKDLERKRLARKDADAEEARYEELKRKTAALAPPAPPAPATPATPDPAANPEIAALQLIAAQPAPELDDVDAAGNRKFATYEDWVRATQTHGDAKRDLKAAQMIADSERRILEQNDKAERARVEREKAARADQSALARHYEHIEAFKKHAPDFDAVLKAAAPDVQEIVDDLGPNAMNVIDRYTVEDAGETGPAIIRHLATNPEEMRRIAGLPVPLQLAALGRIHERLEAASPKPGPSSVAPVHQAPEPITPVGSTPTASSVSAENEDYQTYKTRRNREERVARGLPV